MNGVKTITSKNLTAIASIVAGGRQDSAATHLRQKRPARRIPRAASSDPGVKRILVPIDFSEGSRLALRYAAPLAERLGAAITLIHVDPNPFLAAGLQHNPPVLSDDAITRELIELAAQQIGAAFPVETIVRRGQAGVKIVEAAKALGSDLILMPTHAYTGLKRALYGSTAEHVMRHAACPVCTIRNEILPAAAKAMAGRKQRARILVPVDFSDCSRQALRFAGTLARQLGGGLTLFHVVELSGLHVSAAVLQLRLAQVLHRVEAEEKLAAWAVEQVPASVPVQTLVRVGAPSLELIERGVEWLGCDLIVMGTHEYSWMRRLLEGGGTEHMARIAPCPVVSVHSSASAEKRTARGRPIQISLAAARCIALNHHPGRAALHLP